MPLKLLGMLLPTLAATMGSAAEAKEAAGRSDTARMRDVETVIVTAQKQEERLQDVPVPVTAISATSLAENNEVQLQQYYTRIPGLGLAVMGDTDSPTITIRGISTGGFTNPTVGVVIDDVPYGGTYVTAAPPSPPDIDPSDLARVEVLRGPQGTLYGASSMGGLLKYVTVDPSVERFSGRVQLGITGVEDGEMGRSIRGAVNIPLADTFAVRLSGFTSREPGYVDNALIGQNDINRRDSDGGRLSALWRPTEQLSIKFNALIQDAERKGASDVDVTLGGLRQNAVRGTGVYGRDTEAYNATINLDLSTVQLTSVTGYSVDKLFTNGDLTAYFGGFYSDFAESEYGVSGVPIPVNRRTEKFTQELRGMVNLGENVRWLVGAFYSDEDATGGGGLYAADPASGAVAGPLYVNDSPTTFNERALFTNVTVDITEQFDVQVGGRYSENEQSLSAVRSGPLALLFFGEDPSAIDRRESRDSVFTYLVTPRYKISDDLMVYFRAASGYRAGGLNLGCGLTPCSVDPDTTRNYELGIKGSVLDQALTFDASIYHIDWRDMQLTLVQNGFGYQDNAGRARSRGFELSMEAQPLDEFSVSGWVAYSDAALSEDFPATSQYSGRSGDQLPFSSRWSGNLSLEQQFPIGSQADGFVGVSASYVDDRRGTFQAGAEREIFPSYTQYDLRAGFVYESWSLNAFVNNLSDERGVLRGGLDSNSPTFVSYITPRTIGVSLTRTF